MIGTVASFALHHANLEGESVTITTRGEAVKMIHAFQIPMLLLLTLGAGAATSRAAEPTVLDLWPGKPPGQTAEPGKDTVNRSRDGNIRLTDVTRPQIHITRPVKWVKDTGTAVIIAPGGGYRDLGWEYEAEPMAAWLNDRGVTAVMLKYRVPLPLNKPLGALQDGQRAVSLVRNKAEELGIAPDRIGMIGFSAGGGVAGHALLNPDTRSYEFFDDIDKTSCRLNFAVLIYTSFNLGSGGERGNVNVKVPKDTPPTFLAVAGDDFLAEGAVLSYLALKRAGASAELHVYAAGGHGFGGNIMHPPDRPLVADWTNRLDTWMHYQKLLDPRPSR
jgi:acetyl esterase/lipase